MEATDTGDLRARECGNKKSGELKNASKTSKRDGGVMTHSRTTRANQLASKVSSLRDGVVIFV